jgi:hypothetical protein
MPTKLIRRATALLVAVGLFISARANAGLYTFINIADTTTAAPVGNYTSFGNHPSIGSAFNGNYGTGSGVFSWQPLKTIVKTGDAAPTGVFTSFGETATRGITSFLGNYTGGSGIFRGNGGALTTIAKTGDPAPSSNFTGFGNPAVETSAIFGLGSPQLTAFRGVYPGGSGIFTGSGGALTTMIKTGDAAPSGEFTDFGDPSFSSVNGPGGTPIPAVAFRGTYGAKSGIFVKSNGIVTPIATTDTFPAISFGDPYLLHSSVAFRANPGIPGLEAIYINGGFGPVVAAGQPAPVGTFTSFGDPIITFQGMAFEATYGGGLTGIFESRLFGAPVAPILKAGDPLFGARVLSVSLGRFGGSSSGYGLEATGVGNFAVSYALDNGRTGIALIYALPEPSTMSMVGIAALSLICVQVPARKRSPTAG